VDQRREAGEGEARDAANPLLELLDGESAEADPRGAPRPEWPPLEFAFVGPRAGLDPEAAATPAWLIASAALLFVFALASAIAWNRCLFQQCPDVTRLNAYRPGHAPVVLDRHGARLDELVPSETELVRLAALPRHVGEAFVAVEDRRFREHGAVDWRRVIGAAWADLRAGRAIQGSSTLSMQLARSVFPDRLPLQERTLARKLLEVRVAAEIERTFGKDAILELYLNHVYLGNGSTGVEAAARNYFGKRASQLDLPSSALLAALVKAPGRYDPRRNPEEARARRDLVLGLMQAQGRIPPEEARAARAAPLGVVARRPRGPASGGYFVEEVRRELEARLGEALYEDALRITTTLDAATQRAAEEELVRQLDAIERGSFGRFSGPRYEAAAGSGRDTAPYLQGAVVVLDAATGDVLAWVGGRDFEDSRFDRVRGSRRQAGSAFKPFVYAAALEAGRGLNDRVLDEPLELQLDRRRVWAPRNYDGVFEGPVTLRDALVRSKNVATVRLAQELGTGHVADLARRAGIAPPIPREPSMALGTVSVSLLELATAYSTLAGLGVGVAPRLVQRVERPDGQPVWQAPPPQRRHVLDEATAFLITDTLREALSRGTGSPVRGAGFSAPAAGKTGTTNDGADAWFVGYTADAIAGVWVGFDERRPIVARATGGRLAAPIWGRLMSRVYAGKVPPRAWPRPTTVVEGWVDRSTGFVLAAGCRPTDGMAYRELFVLGRRPAAVCPDPGEPRPMEATIMGIELPDAEQPLAAVEHPAGTRLVPAGAEGDTGVRSYVPSWLEPRPQPRPSPSAPPP
jgi:penicillin-binding protein 1A